LQIIKGWSIAESTDLKNRRIGFSAHAFPEGLEKNFNWGLKTDESRYRHFSCIVRGQEIYDGLALLQCSEIDLIESCHFTEDFVKLQG
jgi:hypothetical protein